jgi:hypothetical protein
MCVAETQTRSQVVREFLGDDQSCVNGMRNESEMICEGWGTEQRINERERNKVNQNRFST